MGIFALAFWRYREGYRKMQEEGSRLIPLWWIGVLTAVLILSSLAAGLLLLRVD